MLTALFTSRLGRWIMALLVGGLLLTGAYARGRGAGVRAEQVRTAAEHQARQAAEALQATLATQLRQQNDAADAAAREAKAQQAKARQLANDLATARTEAARDDARWRAKLATATAKPECRALQEDLCDSVLDY